MDVSGQLHILAAVPWEEVRGSHCVGTGVSLTDKSYNSARNKTIILWSSSCSVATMLIELSWLPIKTVNNKKIYR